MYRQTSPGRHTAPTPALAHCRHLASHLMGPPLPAARLQALGDCVSAFHKDLVTSMVMFDTLKNKARLPLRCTALL